jgi:hypothetical protein
MEKGQVPDALGEFQAAVGLEFRMMSARRNVALALRDLNRISEAADYIEQTMQALGPDPVLLDLRNSLKRRSAAK